MTSVYVLTVTDLADFGQVKHHSAWTSFDGAQAKAHEVIDVLTQDDDSGLGNTYDIDITQLAVNH